MGTERYKIMLVDDNVVNLMMGKQMLKEYYEVFPAPSAKILFDLLENVMPDLILLDVEMPDMDGYEAIKKLKSEPKWASIPVMFLTSRTDAGSELAGLTLGAIDYIVKPFSAPLLLTRIENQLTIVAQKRELQNYNHNLQEIVGKKTEQITKLQDGVISTIAELVETRDNVTGAHIERTERYLQELLDQMVMQDVYTKEIAEWDFSVLIPSAQLHDVGKISISDLILNKPGKLSESEFATMQKHTTFGEATIDRIQKRTEEHQFLNHAKQFVISHHEKWDGTGYPNGLAGTDIPLEGRLMAICDVYDALISTRPYKPSFTHEEARDIIIQNRGTHFDPTLVDVFEKVADKFESIAKSYA